MATCPNYTHAHGLRPRQSRLCLKLVERKPMRDLLNTRSCTSGSHKPKPQPHIDNGTRTGSVANACTGIDHHTIM